MGYSIMAPFKTEKEKKQMEEFLKKEFRSFKELLKEAKIRFIKTEEEENLPPHSRLAYPPETKTPVLGYNYGGSMGEERDYFFVLCYWMAIQAGDRHSEGKHQGKPYIIYDGYQNWTLFINEEPDKTDEWVEVDENGYRKMTTLSEIEHFPKKAQMRFKKEKEELEKLDSVIKEELNRLTVAWKEFVKESCVM